MYILETKLEVFDNYQTNSKGFRVTVYSEDLPPIFTHVMVTRESLAGDAPIAGSIAMRICQGLEDIKVCKVKLPEWFYKALKQEISERLQGGAEFHPGGFVSQAVIVDEVVESPPQFFSGGPVTVAQALEYSKAWKGPPLKKFPAGYSVLKELSAVCPSLKEVVEYPKECREACDPDDEDEPLLDEVIIHLNDFHKWTREDIADWLETIDLDIQVKLGE